MFSAWAIRRMVVVLPEMISPYPLLPESGTTEDRPPAYFPHFSSEGLAKGAGGGYC